MSLKKRQEVSAPRGGRTLFTLEMDAAGVRARKTCAPACRAHADKRRKPPRRPEDFFAQSND